jgi:mevalonate kinase
MRIMVHSEIPRAAGLGSSASFAVCLTSSLFHFLKGEQISQELLLRIGVEMENVFHGRRGSGLDVYTVTYGGILKYDK